MTFDEHDEMDDVECDVPFYLLERGEFNIIYAHPETYSRKKFGSYQ